MAAWLKRPAVSEAAKIIGVFLLGMALAAGFYFLNEALENDSAEEQVETDTTQNGEADPELRAELVAQLAGPDHALALDAANALRERGWLEDGTLAGTDLSGADLHGAYLYKANLDNANLRGADLRGARLSEASLLGADLRDVLLDGETSFHDADLQGAILADLDLRALNLGRAFGERPVNLQEADLSGTDLRGVNFWQSSLAGADLRNADLRGANLTEADLDGANVSGTQSDQTTVLPDGTTWSQDTDWGRFTDSAHPDFWRSDNPDSPAYQDQK